MFQYLVPALLPILAPAIAKNIPSSSKLLGLSMIPSEQPTGWDAILDDMVMHIVDADDDVAIIYEDSNMREATSVVANTIIVFGCKVHFKSLKAANILCLNAHVQSTSIVADNIYVHGGSLRTRILRAQDFILDEYEIIKDGIIAGDPSTGIFSKTLPEISGEESLERLRNGLSDFADAYADDADAIRENFGTLKELSPIKGLHIQMLSNQEESYVVEDIAKDRLGTARTATPHVQCDDTSEKTLELLRNILSQSLSAIPVQPTATEDDSLISTEEIFKYFEDNQGKVVGPDGPALTSGKTPGSQSWMTSVCTGFVGDMPSVTKKEELAFLMTAMPEFHAYVSEHVAMEKDHLRSQAKAKKVEAAAASTK